MRNNDATPAIIDAFLRAIAGFILIIFSKGFEMNELIYFGFLCFGSALGSCHTLLCIREDDEI